jgi:hypothetical protein
MEEKTEALECPVSDIPVINVPDRNLPVPKMDLFEMTINGERRTFMPRQNKTPYEPLFKLFTCVKNTGTI